MTPAQAADTLDLWAAKATAAENRTACKMGAAALRGPGLADLRALIPGSRVFVGLLEEDPELGPYCAWIEWREDGKPRELSELARTMPEAIARLRETIGKRHVNVEKTPEDLEYERKEREAIQS